MMMEEIMCLIRRGIIGIAFVYAGKMLVGQMSGDFLIASMIRMGGGRHMQSGAKHRKQN